MTAVLRWSEPVLVATAGDGSWVPQVHLVNLDESTVQVSGPPVADGALLGPDGARLMSRQKNWAIAAVEIAHHLPPRKAHAIRVALSLLEQEISALPPGRYRLTNVHWGELTAPAIDVVIRAAGCHPEFRSRR